MIRKINEPISQIYHNFELRDIIDESSEAKFLASCWCLVYDDIVRAQFSDGDVPTEFDPTSPINDYRKSLDLTIAVERGNRCADLASSIARCCTHSPKQVCGLPTSDMRQILIHGAPCSAPSPRLTNFDAPAKASRGSVR